MEFMNPDEEKKLIEEFNTRFPYKVSTVCTDRCETVLSKWH